MNVLITGAAGFIGSSLADRLIADGHQVVGIDDLTTGLEQNISPEMSFYKNDIRNTRLLPWDQLGPSDLIIHCAASYKDPQKWHRDADVNVLGTIDVTLQAKHAGCPIVYMQTALPPVSSYAISKTAGMQYIQQSGVPHLIFRLANIYGPRNLSGPIPTFAKRIMAGEQCTVVDTVRDMVYIDDLVDCVMQGIGQEERGVYDVCSGENTAIIDLFAAVDVALAPHLAAKNPEPIEVDPEPAEAMTQVDPNRRISGWKATTHLWAGIEKACDWYRDNPPAETFTHLRQTEPANV